MKTQERVLRLIEKYSKIESSEIQITSKIKDLKFESLELLEFQMDMDDEFGIEITIDEFLSCNNVSDIINLVEKYLSK